MGIVYILTDNTNGKQYVDSTNRSIEDKIKEYKSNSDKASTPITKAIRDHGWTNFSCEVLFESHDYGALLARESEEITSRRTYGEGGYNKKPSNDILTFRSDSLSRTVIRMVMDEDRCTQTDAIKKLLGYGSTVWLQNSYKTQG
jgi:group I intron endonuclease